MLLIGMNPDALGGGAGWLGAGLLGLVLSWLLLKHLPEKDRLILDMLKQYRDELTIERSKCEARDSRFCEALKVTGDHIAASLDRLRDSRNPDKRVG
jgi:hypothetical protein